MNEQMRADLLLDTGLAFPYLETNSKETGQGTILLSGATGFLGAFLLQELLARQKTSKVICLVRARDDEHAMMKVLAAMRSYDLDAHRMARVNAIAADISHPSMGIPERVYNELAGSVQTIIHAAAHVNLVLPYRVMRKSNVLGTYAMLQLCGTGAKKALHYISSVSVFGRGSENGPCLEAFSIPKSDTLASGYAQSKWVSEQLIAAAAKRGLHACIYRPGLITGHSKTGVWHKRDSLSLKILACMRLHTVPVEKEDIGMTPIDYVSTAIERLAVRGDSAGKAFHLVNRRAVSWEDITRALRAQGYVDEAVSYPRWMALLRAQFDAHPADVDLARAASLFSMIGPSTEVDAMPDIDDTNTREALRSDGEVQWPCEGAGLLPQYFAWIAAHSGEL